MEKKSKSSPMRRDFFTGAIRAMGGSEEAGQNDTRQVELSLSSEEPYTRWFGTEILCHDPGAIDLSRLQDIGVVLFNHDSNTVIGRVDSVTLDEVERKLRATVTFDDDEDSERIYQKVKNGTLKGVSVGYRVSVWEEVGNGAVSSNGRFMGPCEVATKWTPYEISIVAVPADPTVGVGRSYEPENGEGTMDNKNKKPTAPMPEGTKGMEPPADNGQKKVPGGQPEANTMTTRTMEAERKRCSTIMTLCRQFDMDPMPFITGGQTVEATRAAVLENLANTRQPQGVTVQADEADKFRAAAADGLAMRAGIAVEKPASGAEEFRGMSLVRLAAESLSMDGKNVRHMDDTLIMREALTGTGAFPGILSNVANKSLAQAYQLAPTTFQDWTAKGSNKDFKTATRYHLSEAPSLTEINENGEFKHAELKEDFATTKVQTYGATFSITMQALVNDDLGALSRQPAEFGIAARRDINERVYKLIRDNGTFNGTPLFSAKRGNVQTAGLTVAGLGTMKAAMARQTGIAGKQKLNIQPAFLIVPPELEVQAAQLINSVVDPSKNNAAVNPFANKLSVISDPELTDAKTFYLVAAPGYVPTIEVTYLNGQEAPTIESAIQFDTLGIKWRIYQHVGVNIVDFRGIQKSTME